MKRLLKATVILSLVLFVSGCGARKVQRIDPSQVTDLSGRWNDSDSRLTADELTKQVLGEKWLTIWERENNNKRPVLIVGLIRNKSSEHIDADMFIKNIERAIINDGSVRLVQAGEKREELRGERADQQKFSSLETAKKWGLELGADLMLQGTINSSTDQLNKQKTVYYQINLELTNLQTNEKVWVGEKQIKKFVTN
jgi:penicillin-binding protein activator